MEKSLFGLDYSNQADEARLKRIEEIVYGEQSASPVAQRVGKLSKDLSVDLMGQEIKPKADTFADEDGSSREGIPKADSNVNYPIVDKLEDQTFKKEYKTLDINKRLVNLEQKTFSKTYDNDSLNERVERLKTAILRQDYYADNSSGNSSDYSDDHLSSQSMSQNEMADPNLPSQDDNFGTPDYNSQKSVLDDYKGGGNTTLRSSIRLSSLEKSILKRSFPDDSVSDRLSRLENIVFNTSFDQDDTQTRVNRLSSAYQAQKSARKYDSNKMSQHVATAMQIGAMLLMVLAFVL